MHVSMLALQHTTVMEGRLVTSGIVSLLVSKVFQQVKVYLALCWSAPFALLDPDANP